jgi:hypothetical protein
MRGPGSVTFDLGLMKQFPIKESLRLQFRAELFNAFNTPRFGSPYASLSAPARMGKIESASDPRIVQFGLKASF